MKNENGSRPIIVALSRSRPLSAASYTISLLARRVRVAAVGDAIPWRPAGPITAIKHCRHGVRLPPISLGPLERTRRREPPAHTNGTSPVCGSVAVVIVVAAGVAAVRWCSHLNHTLGTRETLISLVELAADLLDPAQALWIELH
jgi:hypothetical protein